MLIFADDATDIPVGVQQFGVDFTGDVGSCGVKNGTDFLQDGGEVGCGGKIIIYVNTPSLTLTTYRETFP